MQHCNRPQFFSFFFSLSILISSSLHWHSQLLQSSIREPWWSSRISCRRFRAPVMGRNSHERERENERQRDRERKQKGEGDPVGTLFFSAPSASFLAPLPGLAWRAGCSSGCHCLAIDARGSGPSSLCHSVSTRRARSSLVAWIF